MGHAGIVDDDIETAEFTLNRFHHGAHLRVVLDIGSESPAR